METESPFSISIRRALERLCRETLSTLKEAPSLSVCIPLWSDGWRGCLRLAIPIAIEEAVRPVPATQVGALRETFFADRHGKGTARVKAATAGRIDQARNLSTRRQRSQASPRDHSIRVGSRREQ